MQVTTEYQWIPSRGRPVQFSGLLGLTAAFVVYFFVLTYVFLGDGGLVDSLRFIAPGGNGDGIFLIYILSPAVILIGATGALLIPNLRIGIGPDGVRVLTRLGARVVPWNSLRPGEARSKSQWCTLRQATSGWRRYRIFWVTKDQAKSILTSPNAPAHLFPPEYWAGIGVTPPGPRG